MKAIIISDVAGRFDELIRLTNRYPDRQIILVGDLNDRGPKSKQVIEWVMSNPLCTALHSNHGDMFVDFVLSATDPDYERAYDYEVFLMNGGYETLKSYGATPSDLSKIPMRHIQWLASRPLLYMETGLMVSHAPIAPGELALNLNEKQRRDFVWNRREPEQRDRFQVFGHNSMWGTRKFGDWAVCIDTSASGMLAGFLWPERTFDFETYGGVSGENTL